MARKDTKRAAAQWSRAVFAMYGRVCVLHKARNPRSRVQASHAAHIFKRSHIGAALAYCSVRLGRPLCVPCHRIQELGLDPAYAFSLADRIDAALAHNEVAKSKIAVPTE